MQIARLRPLWWREEATRSAGGALGDRLVLRSTPCVGPGALVGGGADRRTATRITSRP